MVHFSKFVLGLTGGLLASGGLGHPGGHEKELNPEVRGLELKRAGDAMAICAEKHQANGFAKRNAERRAFKAAELREKRNIGAGSWGQNKLSRRSSLAPDHNQTMEFPALDPDNPNSGIWDDNAQCVLSSDAMVGPYYVDGELIREDVTQGQRGVSLDVDFQIVDMTTCEPMTGKYIDLWHSNATGVYSGVVAQGNGNAADRSNLNNTFARGISPTDEEGVVQFHSIFPGHYAGRTIHIHIISHQEGQVLPNNTFESGQASHVGQIYFDQDLISEVEAQPPYTENTQPFTTNDGDFILQEQLRSSAADPFMDYVYLGDDISEGLFAWITLVIDPSASFDTPAASHWTEHGGVPANGSLGPPPGANPGGA